MIVKLDRRTESLNFTGRVRLLFKGKIAFFAVLLAACVCFPLCFLAGGYFSKKQYTASIIKPFFSRAVAIPVHFVQSLPVHSDKMHLKMDRKDLQKFDEIRKKKILVGTSSNTKDDFIPINIRFNEENTKARIRPISLMTDSVRYGWEVEMKGNCSILGIRSFWLKPFEPDAFIGHRLIHKIFNRQCGFSHPETHIVKLLINSVDMGAFAVWEKSDNIRSAEKKNTAPDKITTLYERMLISMDSQSRGNSNTGACPPGNEKKKLDDFKGNLISAEKVFDLKKTSFVFALLDLCGYKYTTAFSHIRFLYDPEKQVWEPVGFGQSFFMVPRSLENTSKIMKNAIREKPENIPLSEFEAWYAAFFKDTAFSSEYVHSVDSLVNRDFFKAFVDSLRPDYDFQIRNIYKIHPWFSDHSLAFFIKNREYLFKQTHPMQTIQAYFKTWDSLSNVLTLQIGNIQGLPVRIASVRANDLHAVLMSVDAALPPKAPFDFIDFKEFQFGADEKYAGRKILIDSLCVFYSLYGSGRIESETVYPWTYLD